MLEQCETCGFYRTGKNGYPRCYYGTTCESTAIGNITKAGMLGRCPFQQGEIPMSDVKFPAEDGFYWAIVNLPQEVRPDPRAPVNLDPPVPPVPTEYNAIIYYEQAEQTVGLLGGSVPVERRAPKRIPRGIILAVGPKIERPTV